MQKVERKSNIELLRIISMCGVIILHFNNSSIGGGLDIMEKNQLNGWLSYILESMFICSVNVFILISAYFLSNTYKRKISKVICLLSDVIVLSVIVYFAKVIIMHQRFSISSLIAVTIPANWFVILYITLYLISPYINLVINNLSNEQLKRMLALFVILFSIMPTLADILCEISGREWMGISTIGAYGSGWGYTIINFILVYTIGAYLRKNEDIKIKHLIFKIVICVCTLSIWAYINNLTGFYTERSAWEYCNPIILLEATYVFLLFKRLEIPNIRLVNRIAQSAFMVYLLHGQFVKRFYIKKLVESNILIMFFGYIVMCALIYLICCIIDTIYKYAMTPYYRAVEKFDTKDIRIEK